MPFGRRFLRNCRRQLISLSRLPREARHYMLARSPASQVASKAEYAQDHSADHDGSRDKVLSFIFRLTNLAKPSACENTPMSARDLFAAIGTKSGTKQHLLDRCSLQE